MATAVSSSPFEISDTIVKALLVFQFARSVEVCISKVTPLPRNVKVLTMIKQVHNFKVVISVVLFFTRERNTL